MACYWIRSINPVQWGASTKRLKSHSINISIELVLMWVGSYSLPRQSSFMYIYIHFRIVGEAVNFFVCYLARVLTPWLRCY